MRKPGSRDTLLAVFVAVTVVHMSSCGRGSSSDEDGGGDGAVFSGNMQNIAGTITSQGGNPSQMRSWVVALLEGNSRVARTTAADASGILRWNKVSLEATQTAVLLSPDYLLQSIMAMPSTKVNTVKQYFTIQNQALPQLVQKGPTMAFQNSSGITLLDVYSADNDADGSPNGTGALGLTGDGFNLAAVDTDSDGVSNSTDGDIDGDGLLNSFDNDDDGDGLDDIFDSDANGNLVADSQEAFGDAYYGQGIEYFTVRYEQGQSVNSFQFVLKVRSGLKPESVKIKTATSLIDGAVAVSGDGTTAAWDVSLLDNGSNFDGAEGDLLYARKIQLAAGKTPRVNQVIFAQVTFGTGASAFTLEYPWIFPNITTGAITSSYNSAGRVVTLAGDPFGASFQDFAWSVTLTNADGLKVYESAAIAGGTRTLTIPANILQSGATYSYEVVAQTRDKVPGMPAAAVRSAKVTITN